MEASRISDAYRATVVAVVKYSELVSTRICEPSLRGLSLQLQTPADGCRSRTPKDDHLEFCSMGSTRISGAYFKVLIKAQVMALLLELKTTWQAFFLTQHLRITGYLYQIE